MDRVVNSYPRVIRALCKVCWLRRSASRTSALVTMICLNTAHRRLAPHKLTLCRCAPRRSAPLKSAFLKSTIPRVLATWDICSKKRANIDSLFFVIYHQMTGDKITRNLFPCLGTDLATHQSDSSCSTTALIFR